MAKRAHPHLTVVASHNGLDLIFCSSRKAFTVVKSGCLPPNRMRDNSRLWAKSIRKAYEMFEPKVPKRDIHNVPVVGKTHLGDKQHAHRYTTGTTSYVNGRVHTSPRDLVDFLRRIPTASPAKVNAALRAVNAAAAKYDAAVKRVHAVSQTATFASAYEYSEKHAKTKTTK